MAPTTKKNVLKGACMLEMADSVIAPSAYTDFAQLASSGWIAAPASNHFLMDLRTLFQAEGWSIDDFELFDYFQATLQKSPKPTTNALQQPPQYQQPWLLTPNGLAYRAEYKLWVNPVAGALIVELAYKPHNPLLRPPTPTPNPPPLTRLSDYAFLVYQYACQHSANAKANCLQGLQWVIHNHVENPVSSAVALQALHNRGLTAPHGWPGTKFDTSTSDDAKALVGCPNGNGVVWMLAQHIVVLGASTVDY
ncbi:MAG: hypothetical protein LQ340_004696, partial [Diploschistes diacapsis]